MIHRILHLADLHLSNNLPWGKMLDFDMEGFFRTRINSRQLEIYDALDYAVSKVIELNCKTMVIAGDIYDYWRPSELSRAIFAKFLKRLVKWECEVIVITGQHDVGNETGLLATRTLLQELAPKVSFVWESNTTSYYSNEQEYFLVPYQAFERFKRSLTNYSFRCELAAGHYKNTIFVGHFPVCGITLASGKALEDANWLSYDDYSLLLDSFKAVMLGDIHIRQMAYPGSLIRLDFGDMSPEKGFYIWEFEEGKEPKRQFHAIPNSTKFAIVTEHDTAIMVRNKIVRAEATTLSRLNEVVELCKFGGAQLVVPKLITKLIERVNKIQGMTGTKLDIKTAIIDFVDKTGIPCFSDGDANQMITEDAIVEAGMKYAEERT